MKVFTPLLFLVASAHGAQLVAQQGAGLNPVSRIVQLLESLHKKMIQDKEADQSAFEKYECWCETMKKAKARTIEESNDRIEKLKQEIEDANTNDILPGEKAGHESDIADFKNKIKSLTDQRDKFEADSNAKIAELDGLAEALGTAVTTLSDAQPQSLMAMSAVLGSTTSTYEQAQAVADIMQAGPDASKRNSANTQVQGYDTQTQGLIDKLNKMKSQMETESSDTATKLSQETENFNNMISETEGLLQESETAMSDAEGLKGKRAGVKSRCDAEIALLEEAVRRDEEMVQVTNFNCAEETKRFNHRIEIRNMELKAFAEAMSILSAEGARDSFNSSFDSQSFLQMAMAPGCNAAKRIHKAALALMSVKNTVSYKVRAMLHSRKGDQFTGDENIKDILGADNFQSIMTAIDDSISDLKDRIADDDSTLQTEQEKNRAANEKASELSNKIDNKGEERTNQLATAKEELEKEADAIREQNEIKEEMRVAKEAREEEAAEAAQAARDDAEAVRLLAKAIKVLEDNKAAMAAKNEGFQTENLKEFTGEGTGFIQTDAPDVKAGEKLPPPPETAHYDEGSHDGEGDGVVKVLTMIKDDVEKDITTSAEDEAAAIKAYNDAKDAMTASLNKEASLESEAKGLKNAAFTAATTLTEEIEDGETGLKTQLKSKMTAIADMKEDLNWMGTNIGTRVANARKEIAALQSAKTLLGGGASFLQRC